MGHPIDGLTPSLFNPAMLHAEHLHLAVPGKILCRDLSMAFEPGQCWGILGRNGSGKTTLLHALSGLSKPLGGTVRLGETPVLQIPPRQLARRVGVLLQEEAAAGSGPVLDYVVLGRFPHHESLHPSPEDLEAARSALDATGMSHAEMQSMATLSGGERQRVRIAQLLAQAPDICLLDEPLQHLDLPHQLATMRLLRRLAREEGKTVIMVLHDIYWASHFCSHALLIGEGGEISAGECATTITLENMESLYQCRFQSITTTDGKYFLPNLE